MFINGHQEKYVQCIFVEFLLEEYREMQLLYKLVFIIDGLFINGFYNMMYQFIFICIKTHDL